MSTSTSLLESLLQLPDAQLQHSVALPNVYSVLVSLLSSQLPPSDRQLLHLVVSRLSRLKGALDLTLLILYVKRYYIENRRLVENLVNDAFSTSLSLKQTYTKLIPSALAQEVAAQQGGGGTDEAVESLLILYVAVRDHLTPTDSTGTTSILSDLDRIYREKKALNDSKDDQVLLLVLSAASSLLTLPSLSLDQLDQTLQIALQLPASTLIKDIEIYLGVSRQLGERVQGQVGPVARHVKDGVGKLKKLGDQDEKGKGKQEEGWIERVQRKKQLGGNADCDIDETSLETSEIGDEAEEAQLLSTISSVQELLPHLSTRFLRLALNHPSFRPAANQTPLAEASERLVSALLENDLPQELQGVLAREANRNGAKQKEEEVVARSEQQERRNVFDEDKTFSKGRLMLRGRYGGARAEAGTRSLDERLKESIIALAERESSDEDEEEGEAFLQDDEDGRAGGAIKVGVRDNGEEDEEDDNVVSRSGAQTPAPADPSNLFTPATVQLLEQTYLSSPSVFASDSVTRRTNKQRIKLREQTGLDDNQLEGWKRMLERGGEKNVQKLKDRMMDLNAKGNHDPAPQSPSSSSSSSRGGRGGRGGARGGSGGASRGGGTSNRGKGDGGRAQHDRRKRGNDKKLQKMGATL